MNAMWITFNVKLKITQLLTVMWFNSPLTFYLLDFVLLAQCLWQIKQTPLVVATGRLDGCMGGAWDSWQSCLKAD